MDQSGGTPEQRARRQRRDEQRRRKRPSSADIAGRGGASRSTRVKHAHDEDKVANWDEDWAREKVRNDVTEVYFGSNFNIRDVHISAIASSGFCEKLRKVQFGDDDTGIGSSISDAAIKQLAQACPQLLEVNFTSAVALSDAALLALVEHCPQLTSINVCGNDKIKGNIRGSCFDQLIAKPDFAPRLQTLSLIDERVGEKKIKALSRARRALTIREGDTVGDGFAAQMVASMTGGETLTEWRNGKTVGMGTDYGMAGYGGFGRPWRGGDGYSDIEEPDEAHIEEDDDDDESEDDDDEARMRSRLTDIWMLCCLVRPSAFDLENAMSTCVVLVTSIAISRGLL
ncbi:Uu.00g098090.m01.CDS01 [Anthostomella pinea]|uniref:Uu.00g098090.m01.CDS01 n=1 Tax=Anthostomella pinea TaxID=933095 RepID=A0AAI8VCH5_9PEZI|nr:Uu.00g098090.m01.CDS01 [Anthostomella pinea]